ncbi:putative signal transducing protein [Poriferisphaera sp. WC338]|uniref:putative signal transducing protein n=1 Tax=Poriferisphaera sp. WC338 TaxID=3425129 RepID=UPI003D816F7D
MPNRETSHPEDPTVVTSVETELEASLLIESLAEQGIEATSAGQITSGFRAEAPGLVNVLVHIKDLDKAKAAVEAFNKEHIEVDWSSVDFEHVDDEDKKDL